MSIAIRIDETLAGKANAIATVQRRTLPKQIELWAEIGRTLSDTISPEQLLEIQQGWSTVKLEPVKSAPIDPTALMAEVSADSAALSASLQTNRIVYQCSKVHPGKLEQLHPDGSRYTGIFKNGCFVADE